MLRDRKRRDRKWRHSYSLTLEKSLERTFTGGTEGCHKDNPGATCDGNVDIVATRSRFPLSTKIRHD